MAKNLVVSSIKAFDPAPSISAVSKALDDLPRHTIGEAPWSEYPYKPAVQFAIAQGSNAIFLKFFVQEKELRATHYKINQPVFEDSCVEFFISFDEKGYYNFEFNSIGTCLAGYGASKTDRTLLPEPLLSRIRYQSMISNEAGEQSVHWTLTIRLPLEVFTHHTLSSLPREAKANFYKCGDLLTEPHFLCWSPIEWPEPNFHLPLYFGSVTFEP